MRESAHIFLGANSGEGFYSLYDQLLGGAFYDLLILKGGPGCGKSSFMRRIAERLHGAGLTADYIHCSGDPASLDGVIFPEIHTALVDGTAPHVIEPEYAVAVERYVDLTRFYDVSAVKQEAAGEIIALSDTYREAYRNAYHVLRAAAAIESERRAILRHTVNRARLDHRIDGIIRRELHAKGKPAGSVSRAFLGGMTCEGYVFREDTVHALCRKVYELEDDSGIAGESLQRLCDAAVGAGYRVLACPDPDRPKELQHLLIPDASLAFITANGRRKSAEKPYRRIRIDAMAQANIPRADRSQLRLIRRIEQSLTDEGTEMLRRAKSAHDALESVYNPYVDFDGVYALADAEAERLLSYRE